MLSFFRAMPALGARPLFSRVAVSRFSTSASGDKMQKLKELRARTGAKVIDCKKALEECDGDLDAAVRVLGEQIQTGDGKEREKGSQGAVSAHVRDTAEGAAGALVDVGCNTDFVARNELFQQGSSTIAASCAEWAGENAQPGEILDVEEAKLGNITGNSEEHTVNKTIAELKFKFGETINVRRALMFRGASEGRVTSLSTYVHGHGKYAALVALEAEAGGKKEELAKLGRDLAVHIVACSPSTLASLAEQKSAVAKKDGSQELGEQAFALNEEKSVSEWLASRQKTVGAPVRIRGFARLQVGEAAKSAVAQ